MLSEKITLAFMERLRRLFGHFVDNAVLLKLFRQHVSGKKFFMRLSSFAGVFSAIVWVIYALRNQATSGASLTQRALTGRLMFWCVLFFQGLAVMDAASMTVDLAEERRDGTLDLIRLSLISPQAVSAGYTLFAFLIMFTSLSVTIPVHFAAFSFGGLSEREIVLSFITMLSSTLGMAALGTFISTLFKDIKHVNISISTMSGLITFGGLLLFGFDYVRLDASFPWWYTPASGISEQGYAHIQMIAIAISPLFTLFFTDFMIITQQPLLVLQKTLSDGTEYAVLSPWLLNILINFGLAVLLTRLAGHNIARMRDEKR